MGREESFRLNSIEKKTTGSTLFPVTDVITPAGISDKTAFTTLRESSRIVLAASRHPETLMAVSRDTLILVLGRKMPVRATFKTTVMAATILKQTTAPVLTCLSRPVLLIFVTFIISAETITGIITTPTRRTKTLFVGESKPMIS